MKRLGQWILAARLVVLWIGVVPTEANDDTTGVLKGQVKAASGREGENTVVYLEGIREHYKSPQEAAVLDQKDKMFTPHLLPVQSGQTVRFKNSDPLSHNVHVYWRGRSMFNKAQAPGSLAEWTAPRPGEYVVLCNLHPEMSAAILVFEHPFYSKIGDSEFTIENIPPGTYALVAVREVRANLEKKETEVTIKGGETTSVVIQY